MLKTTCKSRGRENCLLENEVLVVLVGPVVCLKLIFTFSGSDK
jgi:hypothetical protein